KFPVSFMEVLRVAGEPRRYAHRDASPAPLSAATCSALPAAPTPPPPPPSAAPSAPCASLARAPPRHHEASTPLPRNPVASPPRRPRRGYGLTPSAGSVRRSGPRR